MMVTRHAMLSFDGVQSTSHNPIIVHDQLLFVSDDLKQDHGVSTKIGIRKKCTIFIRVIVFLPQTL